MISSKYNMFFDHEGQKIGFNTFTREFIALDEFVYLMYETAYKQSDFAELEMVHSEFYDFLVQKGFLIGENEDELQKVIDVVNEVDNNDSTFILHINPTMNCNFKCWYCYETHIKDSKMDDETVFKTVSFVEQLLMTRKPNLKQVQISWFGGEPLLYYRKLMVPIMEQINELSKVHDVGFSGSVTSNGLLIDEYLLDTIKDLGINFFQITLDGHRDRHDSVRYVSETRGSYDAIISNIRKLLKNQCVVLVRINCSPDTLSGLFSILDDFADVTAEERNFLKFDFQKVWQDEDKVSGQSLLDIRKYFRKSGFNVQFGTFDLVGDSCYADRRHHATINYNGEVFKCTARDFVTENSEGILGDGGIIQWNEKYENRMNIKFKNKPCLDCFLLPLCNGGCSQQAIEHKGQDYCVNDFDENKKRQKVIERFMETIAAD